MANAQGFTVHPMTMDAASQAPVYSADDVRNSVNALTCAPDGSAFGGLQGIRSGSPSPLVEISGTTVTVHAHAGWLNPWGQAYSYSLAKDATIGIDNTTGGFKIAVVVNDQAAGHGTGETIGLAVYPATTADSSIPGLVVAQVTAGVASDTAVTLQNDMLVKASTSTQLNTVTAPDGCRALLADGTEYKRVGGVWVRGNPRVFLFSSLINTLSGNFAYNALSESDLTAMLGSAWSPDKCSVSVGQTDGAYYATNLSVDHNGSGLNIRGNASNSTKYRFNLTIMDFR